VSFNLENFPWLNLAHSAFRYSGYRPTFFSEVISDGEAGLGVASDIFKTLIDVNLIHGGKNRVLFESTNLSEQYIPYIARKTIEKSQVANLEGDIDKLAEIKYGLIR
jgi:hypothetical protein